MKKRLISIFILIVYSAILIIVMVFKDMPDIRIGHLIFRFGGTQTGPANFLPFKTILPYLHGEKGMIISGINLVGNIVLLVPIGFLVPFVYRSMTWKKTFALAVGAGLAIEGMQALFRVGIFDIDDVILNGLGVMVGYWVFTMLAKREHSMKSKNIIITAVIVVTVLVTAAAFFGIAVHQKSLLPESFRRSTENGQFDRSDSFDNGKGGIPQGDDPCNGTGGTGQIVSVGNKTITIKLNDGISKIINLTDQTTIRNSVRSLSKTDLKTGERVTVVVDGSETATTVLVCNVSSLEPVK